ncbi:type IV secretion system protein [Luteibacter aegosomatis]|uniref:type IV secretion system protein n=1 Tax=Luteibacter aegosomatis TaxID=2911537 RepID=UPI001FF7C4C1|nr:type IV secretion system protein [Luteibacter aegosomatis]UPG86396.1 type IV secretion system protein [Luteibacter aegosomatis]
MPNISSYIYFKLIHDYLDREIATFGKQLMGNTSKWASGISLTLVTLWIFVLGYRILSGQSRGPMMANVLQMGRVAVIVSAASTMTVAGIGLHHFLTVELDKEVHSLFTGETDSTTAQSIDKNLAWTQLALSTIGSVHVIAADPEMIAAKERTTWLATFGSASPAMAAGAMLLLYQFAMALFIGLGPIFILCLIFDQTKELFKKWLMYGIGTVFSMALLSAVTGIVLRLTVKVSEAMWGAKIVNNILGNDAEGLTSTAMQQGGIGLLLTVLIVSVPPMAAMFFQGTLGNFMSYSAFAGGAASQPGPQGQPPGSYHGYPQIASGIPPSTNSSSHGMNNLAIRSIDQSAGQQMDEIKSGITPRH